MNYITKKCQASEKTADTCLLFVLQSIGNSKSSMPFQFPENNVLNVRISQHSFSESMIVK